MLELKQENRTAQDKDGKSYSYTAYYVEVNGIVLTLKPNDATAKQILRSYYESNIIIPIIISVFAILNTLMIVGAWKVSQIRETGKNY